MNTKQGNLYLVTASIVVLVPVLVVCGQISVYQPWRDESIIVSQVQYCTYMYLQYLPYETLMLSQRENTLVGLCQMSLADKLFNKSVLFEIASVGTENRQSCEYVRLEKLDSTFFNLARCTKTILALRTPGGCALIKGNKSTFFKHPCTNNQLGLIDSGKWPFLFGGNRIWHATRCHVKVCRVPKF